MGYHFRFMPKVIATGSFDFGGDFLPLIVDDPGVRQKCAASSVLHQWGNIGPQKNASLIHLIALGAHEATGPNRNGDSFKRAFLREAHPSFIKHGALYRDHKNKDYSKRDGEITHTAFNDDMDRVELLVSADHNKCADWLGELEKGNRVDFSMGFDCFAPGTLIKTSNGDQPIESLKEGDLVLTHRGRFMPVEKLLPSKRGSRVLLEIKMQTQGESLFATNDHRILVVRRDAVRRPSGSRRADWKNRMNPEWVKADELALGDYMLRPVLPLGGEEMDLGTAYLLGQYLGDGCISSWTDDSVAITTHVEDADLLNRMIQECLRLRWDFSVDYLTYDRELYRKKEATCLRIRSPYFATLCSKFCGRLKDKYVRPEVWGWDRDAILAFLGGYIDADGSFDPGTKAVRTCSVLDRLNDTVQQLFFSVGVVATTWKDWFGLRPNGSSFGNKREYANILFVNKSDAVKLAGHSSKVQSGISVREQECIFFDNDGTTYLACPVNEIGSADDQVDTVFCLSVAEDHSFVAEGAVVHNCEYDVCSICHNKAPTRKEYCDCVKKTASYPFGMGRILPDGRKCYVDNPKGVFNDISKVPVGADMIAQSLRKVAGLDEEIIGGAELAEVMYPELSREKFASKIALASKLSRMEKVIPLTAKKLDIEEDKIDEKTAALLREMPGRQMFGELAKLGCLLPLNSFFSLLMGDRIQDLEPFLKEAECAAGRVFSHLAENDELMDKVCAIGLYECAPVRSSKLAGDQSLDLQLAHGMHEEIAERRMMKTAMVGTRVVEPVSPASISGGATELLLNYAAYKIAALESGAFDLNDRLMGVAAARN